MPDFKQLKRDYQAGETLKAMEARTGINVAELSIRLRGMRCKMRGPGRRKGKK